MSDSNQCRFLTSNEAASIANVGEETILKYKELGLLRSFRVNGQEQYREDEIKLIFNSKRKINSKKKTESLQNADTQTAGSSYKSEVSEGLPTLNEILAEISSGQDHSKKQEYITTSTASDSQQNSYTTDYIKNRETPHESHDFDIPSIELLELTRSLKDQLEMIKEERNWLRRRVEKLEASIEREQMITISKSDTIRTLIEATKQTKKTWSFLLPWNRSNEINSSAEIKKGDQ